MEIKMTNYSIDDGHGNAITQGLQPQIARKTAQRIANERGRSVWLYEDGSDEEAEEIPPAPPAPTAIGSLPPRAQAEVGALLDRPLAAAYLAAAAFRDGEHATADDAEAAEAAVETARQAWLESDEIREWEYRGESLGGGRERGFWHAPSEAEAELVAWAEAGTYDEVDHIFIVSDWARQIDPVTDQAIYDGEVASSVTIQPEEPDCTAPDHDWQSPVELVGHGPRANGGGVIYEEVCAHCGVYRVTDTWAQDCLTGQQGLREVSYRPADETSSAWIQAGRDAAMIEACPYSLDRDHRKAPGRYVIEIDDVDVDDDVACAAVREEIKEAIGAGWSVEWTGDGSDLSIEWVGP